MELKGNPKLRPNWIFVARRVGYSVEQCQARWKELKDLQKIQDNKLPESTPPATDPEKMTPPPQPLPSTPNHISPTPTSPANTPPQPSQPDFSPSPTTTPMSPHEASPHEALPLQPAAERAPSENRHPEPFLTRLLAAISFDQFHPLSQACHRINSPAFSFEVRISRM